METYVQQMTTLRAVWTLEASSTQHPLLRNEESGYGAGGTLEGREQKALHQVGIHNIGQQVRQRSRGLSCWPWVWTRFVEEPGGPSVNTRIVQGVVRQGLDWRGEGPGARQGSCFPTDLVRALCIVPFP